MSSQGRLFLGAVAGLCFPLALLAADAAPKAAKLTAAQVVDKHIAARGGLQAWSGVQTIAWNGKMDVGFGDSAARAARYVSNAANTKSVKKKLAQLEAEGKPETAKQVQQRKWDQQDRIANGVDSGKLNAAEASTLENKESQINREERSMKAQDDGHLTAADRATLQQQQNQVSKQIYKDKHNAANQYQGTRKVGQRSENQQDRIAQGVRSGQLTAGEAGHLENEEAAINREKRADRAANGGRLTQAEKQQINRQQNKVSKQIYKDKHNGKRQ